MSPKKWTFAILKSNKTSLNMANYFNTLSHAQKLEAMGQCEFMDGTQFTDGVNALKGKKIVIVGCGAQGLNQGLNMKDSGLDIKYSLHISSIFAFLNLVVLNKSTSLRDLSVDLLGLIKTSE